MVANVIYEKKRKKKKDMKKKEKNRKKERNWVARFSIGFRKLCHRYVLWSVIFSRTPATWLFVGGGGQFFQHRNAFYHPLDTIDRRIISICLYRLWSDNTEQSCFVDLKIETWGPLKTTFRCGGRAARSTYHRKRRTSLNYEYNNLAN